MIIQREFFLEHWVQDVGHICNHVFRNESILNQLSANSIWLHFMYMFSFIEKANHMT